MYAGFILWIFGWAAYNGAVISLILGTITIFHIFYWKRLEERELEAAYGDKYLEYRSRTWF
jgi:protein-S-isoprenylcysteine O-methyltransferase Ste14